MGFVFLMISHPVFGAFLDVTRSYFWRLICSWTKCVGAIIISSRAIRP